MLARFFLLFAGPHAAAQSAYLLYVALGAVVGPVVAYYILKFTVPQLLGISVPYVVVRLLGSRRFIRATGVVLLYVGGVMPTFWREVLAWWVSLSVFQIPLYSIFAALVGVGFYKLLWAVPLYLGENFLVAIGLCILNKWMLARSVRKELQQ